MPQTLDLQPDLLIGEGRDRACYRHPSDPDFCIKLGTKPQKQTRREKDYYLYLLRKGVDMRHVALYVGDVETNLGRGALFPLVRDSDGSVSLTLAQSIQAGVITPAQVDQKLNELHSYLIDNGICTRDISPNNIMVRRRGDQMDLIMIDGVTSPSINPLTIRMPVLIKRAVDKSWISLYRKINALYQEAKNPASNRPSPGSPLLPGQLVH